MKIKKINNKIILKYISIFLVCLILGQAELGVLNPFLFAFFFACLFVGVDEKLISIFTMIGGVLNEISLSNFFVYLTVVFVGLVVYYTHRLMKKRIHLISLFFSFLVSCATYIYYNFFELKKWILFLSLGLVTLLCFVVALQVVFLKKNCFKLTLDEKVCLMFSLAVIALGVAPIHIFEFSIFRLFAMVIILLCVPMNSQALTFSVVLSFSLGGSLQTMSLVPVAEFMVLALLSNIFSMPSKIKISLVVIVADVLLQFYFISKNQISLFSILPIVIACLIFLVVPNKTLNLLSDVVYVKQSEISSRNLINSTRRNIKKRMAELSDVFLDMKQIHMNMTKKELTKGELSDMLSREILSSCCKDCLDKNRCTRSIGTENLSCLSTLIQIAINKGKISLLDVPSSMTNRCAKVNQLVTLTNRLIDEYKQFKNIMADVNNVKILMADQMGAVSKLLLDVGEEIDSNVRFDIARENKIISKLLSLNVQCKEVLLYTEKNKDISVVVVVRSESAYSSHIEKVVSETLKLPMQITKITPMEEIEYYSVQLRKKSKYDCVFGLASCNKAGNEDCGDCHSIIRLGRDKFLLALCDGMGAGTNAHKLSAMTLGLIENFYKVGFDNDTILESVNKLLSINNQENYSTLDVCLIDLENELADFIKVGAPCGVVKQENNVRVIEGGALPIGALDTISPKTTKTTISTKDIVIMATDGITDAFETTENLLEFVANLATNNPQTIADAILNEAVGLSEMSPKDDMTVLVARTFLKSK